MSTTRDISFNLPAMVLDQFDRVPTVCWNESYSGMSEFAFGDQDGPMIRALHRSGNGLERWIGNNTLDNAAALIKLARLGVLDSHVALVPEQSTTGEECTPLPRDESTPGEFQGFLSEKLPYQLEFADKYVLDASTCGHFEEGEKPKWFLWNESELSLEDPKEHTEEEGYQPTHFWPTEAVCPNWRVLCGAREPPNLAAEFVGFAGKVMETFPDKKFSWVPNTRLFDATIDRVELDLARGRLPRVEAHGWTLVDESGGACNVRTLRELMPPAEQPSVSASEFLGTESSGLEESAARVELLVGYFRFENGELEYVQRGGSVHDVPLMSREAMPTIAAVPEGSPGFGNYRERVRNFAKVVAARRKYLAPKSTPTVVTIAHADGQKPPPSRASQY